LGPGATGSVANGGGGGGGVGGQDCGEGGGGAYRVAGGAGDLGVVGMCKTGMADAPGGGVDGTTDLVTSVLFGGAGGEGGYDEDGGFAGIGGNGGGLIFVRASSV